MNSIFRYCCTFSAIICFIVSLFLLSGRFAIVGIIPLFFFLFVISTNLMNNIWLNRPLTSYIITILLWVRMVMLPFYGMISGAYSEGTAEMELQQYLLSSVLLCLYDSFAIAFVFFIASAKIKNSTRALITKGLYGQKEVYFVFCMVALVVFVLIGRHMHLFDFVIKPVGEGLEREDEFVDSRTLIVRSIVGSGVTFLFLLFINRFHKKFDLTQSNKYVNLSLLCAVLLIAIITGERRTSQVYKGFASVYLLLSLYPSNRKKTTFTISTFALVVLALMTVYKQFNAVVYDSYSEAIQNAAFDRGFSYGVIDSYFYGIDTIAKNLYYGQSMQVGFSQLVYDFFRNIFGLNFFVPGERLLTTQMYNSIIYSGNQLTGLLLTSVGYGYLFGGFVLAPFATVFNVIVMLFFERCLRNSETIEWQYVIAFVYIRFAFGVLSAPPPLINLVSRLLFIYGIIILIAKMVKSSVYKHV